MWTALLTSDFGTFRRQPASIPTYRAGQKSLESTCVEQIQSPLMERRMRQFVTSPRRLAYLWVAMALAVWVLVMQHADSTSAIASGDASPCYASQEPYPIQNATLSWSSTATYCWSCVRNSPGTGIWTGAPTIPFTSGTGVTLGGSPLRVQGLRLADRGLTGKVPPELGNLTALRTLNLSHNDSRRWDTGGAGRPCRPAVSVLAPQPVDGSHSRDAGRSCQSAAPDSQ